MARRKRKDPADEVEYPIDGDLRKDVVKNVPKGWQPLYLTPDDAERWMQWGAVKEERREGSMRPAFSLSGEGTTDFKVGGLTLYKIPTKIYEARQKMAHTADAERMATVKKQARRSPGGEYVETRE
jgi:hypothetical protein